MVIIKAGGRVKSKEEGEYYLLNSLIIDFLILFLAKTLA
jgi:hypothetical protein